MILYTNFIITIGLPLHSLPHGDAKGTLVLQQFYSAIIGEVCPALRLEIQMIVFAAIGIEG